MLDVNEKVEFIKEEMKKNGYKEEQVNIYKKGASVNVEITDLKVSINEVKNVIKCLKSAEELNSGSLVFDGSTYVNVLYDYDRLKEESILMQFLALNITLKYEKMKHGRGVLVGKGEKGDNKYRVYYFSKSFSGLPLLTLVKEEKQCEDDIVRGTQMEDFAAYNKNVMAQNIVLLKAMYGISFEEK